MQLKQEHFNNGTVILRNYEAGQSHTWELAENIVFDPSPIFPPTDSTTHLQSDGYFLGFFAAIAIEGERITLNCKGYKIEMSEKFHKHQRFFSNIELGSRAFIAGAGPPPLARPETTPGDLRPAKKIKIKNCKLGRSSHHGIHGNNAEEIEILKSTITEFEVAGIACNGCKGVKIADVEIGPSIADTFPAALSQAIFLDRMVNTLQEQDTYLPKAFELPVQIRGQTRKANEWFSTLRTELHHFLNGTEYSQTDPEKTPLASVLKKQGTMKPDGSAIYGIILHKKGPAVGTFGAHPMSAALTDGSMQLGTSITNVNIHDLELVVESWISLHQAVQDADYVGPTPTRQVQGPAGAVFRATHLACYNATATRVKGAYKGNSMSDAWIAVGAVLQNASDWDKYAKATLQTTAAATAEQTAEASEADIIYQRLAQYYNASFIPKDIRDWAAGNYSLDYYKFKTKCDGDAMSHFNKGAMGVRLEYLESPVLREVTIRNIKNLGGPFENETMCSVPSYVGNDARGTVITNCVNVQWNDRSISTGLIAGYGGNAIDAATNSELSA